MKTSQKIYLPLKRLIGILGSFIGILFCLALFWWWIIIINLFATKGHPFFLQKRGGRNGKSFNIIKFRSMRVDANSNLTSDELFEEEHAVTWFGGFLRKTSLDETPQLINILIGNMAFIGPRPLIDKSGDHLTIELRKENGAIALRPGMSGFAQINGRTDISPEDKAALDGYYYKNISLWLDIRIFLLTFLHLLSPNRKEQNK